MNNFNMPIELYELIQEYRFGSKTYQYQQVINNIKDLSRDIRMGRICPAELNRRYVMNKLREEISQKNKYFNEINERKNKDDPVSLVLCSDPLFTLTEQLMVFCTKDKKITKRDFRKYKKWIREWRRDYAQQLQDEEEEEDEFNE